MEWMYKVQVFRQFSVQPLVPVVIRIFHAQPILQSLMSAIFWRIFSTETERPGAAIIIECTETATCEGIPNLLSCFCLDRVKSRIFATKEYLSLYFEAFRAALPMQTFLINCHRTAIQLSASLAECIIEINKKSFSLIVIHIKMPKHVTTLFKQVLHYMLFFIRVSAMLVSPCNLFLQHHDAWIMENLLNVLCILLLMLFKDSFVVFVRYFPDASFPASLSFYQP